MGAAVGNIDELEGEVEGEVEGEGEGKSGVGGD